MKYKNIIFCEDDSQLFKILAHADLNSYLIVKYSGRKIISVNEFDGATKYSCSLFKLTFFSLSAKTVVCEYANGLPRLWATIFGLDIESHIFGALDIDDFDFQTSFKIKFLRKLFTKLYADKYTIYGKFNPTFDLISSISEKYSSSVAFKYRKDLNFSFDQQRLNAWAVYIAQPWKELGYCENAKLQKLIFDSLKNHNFSVFYCKHPRQKFCDLKNLCLIDGWLELKEKIRKDGRPLIAISLSSSLIFELKEMEVNALNLSNRVDGRTIFPTLLAGQIILEREINKIKIL